VPFRKREEHLPHFLKAMIKHQLNNSQENNYEILIIEQGHHLLWILELRDESRDSIQLNHQQIWKRIC
jgi:hypothetical protein